MGTTLLTTGLVCVIAAIVGGGLRAFGFELPVLQSGTRQGLLAIFGGILIVAGVYGLRPSSPLHPSPRPPPFVEKPVDDKKRRVATILGRWAVKFAARPYEGRLTLETQSGRIRGTFKVMQVGYDEVKDAPRTTWAVEVEGFTQPYTLTGKDVQSVPPRPFKAIQFSQCYWDNGNMAFTCNTNGVGQATFSRLE